MTDQDFIKHYKVLEKRAKDFVYRILDVQAKYPGSWKDDIITLESGGWWVEDVYIEDGKIYCTVEISGWEDNSSVYLDISSQEAMDTLIENNIKMREHEQKLQDLFGILKFDDRGAIRDVIEPLLIENRTVFDMYGPHIEEAQNPESGAAERWKRKVLTIIIPNNRKILSFVDANRHLLSDCEKVTNEKFRQHTDDLEAFHIENVRQDSSRFPEEMADIFKD